MTNEEIICAWMETPPPSGHLNHFPASQWWTIQRDWAEENRQLTARAMWKWNPRPLTLDALWEVEERLTDEQREAYARALGEVVVWWWSLIHAKPEQKIAALAAVLRPIVES